jgi:hypothetical protein
MPVRKIDVDLETRVETGAVQFGGDWPGLFIRGDDAYHLLMTIQIMKNDMGEAWKSGGASYMAHVNLDSLAEMIEGDVIVKPGKEA